MSEHGIADLIAVQEPQATERKLPEQGRLHEGEAQAIRLASELALPLLVEEKAGRRVAREMGLEISGIAGQIVRAFRLEFLSAGEAQAMLSEMLSKQRVNQKIYDQLTGWIEKEV